MLRSPAKLRMRVAVVTQSVGRARSPMLLDVFNSAKPDLPITGRSHGVSELP